MKYAYEYAAACLMVGHTMCQECKMACCMQPYFVFECKQPSSDCNWETNAFVTLLEVTSLSSTAVLWQMEIAAISGILEVVTERFGLWQSQGSSRT